MILINPQKILDEMRKFSRLLLTVSGGCRFFDFLLAIAIPFER
jgi:hypothetical protein